MPDVRGACALYYSYQVRGADGRVKVQHRRRTAHSFLIAYARFLYLKIAGAASQSITDTGSVSRTIHNSTQLSSHGNAADTTQGLVVGTGTNVVALADVALQTKIAHGTSAGQLSYGASVVNAPTSDSTSTTLILTRDFSNASGGTITVREIGIYSDMGPNTGKFCIVRDNVTIALASGDVLTLNYILKTTA